MTCINEIKNQEVLFWNYKYQNQKMIYNSERDSYFHDHFKKPIKNLTPSSKVLEVACGTRTDGLELALAGLEMTELDISPVAVKKAEEFFKSQNLNGTFLVADAENLPFADETFSAVFTAASFHHFLNPLKSLMEMKRVVKRGGFVILGVEPNAWPYYTFYLLLKPLKILIRFCHPRPFNSLADDQSWGFTKHQIKKLFKLAGLEILTTKRVKYLQEVYEQYLRLINRLLCKDYSANKNLMIKLGSLDQLLAKIPLLNLFNWYWNVIAKK